MHLGSWRLDSSMLLLMQSDLDSRELVQEIKNFPHLPSKTMSLLELITFMHYKDLSEIDR